MTSDIWTEGCLLGLTVRMGSGYLPVKRIIADDLGYMIRIAAAGIRMALRVQAPSGIVRTIHLYRTDGIVDKNLGSRSAP